VPEITYNKMDIKELHASNTIGKNHPWEHARSKIVLRILRKYVNSSMKGTALDVGSGDAFFLTQFSDRYPNFELIAVDTAFSEELISTIASKNNKYNIRFFNDLQNIVDVQEISIVFLLDVVEHIEDDICFLKNLSLQKYINPNTIFVIAVPAFNYLYSKHDQWLGHYRRYSHATLKQHIEEAGLSYVKGGYFFTSLLFPRCIQKIIEKFRKNQNNDNQGVGNYNGGIAFSFFYEKFLLLDFYFFRIFKFLGIDIPGLSAYVICKK